MRRYQWLQSGFNNFSVESIVRAIVGISILIFGINSTLTHAKEGTVVVQNDSCKVRIKFDQDRFSGKEIENAYEVFNFGAPVSVVWKLTKEQPYKFLDIKELEKRLKEGKAPLDAYKAKAVPKILESYKQRATKDGEFSYWLSETLVNFAKSHKISDLRKPFQDWDHNAMCGSLLDHLEKPTPESYKKALAALNAQCEVRAKDKDKESIVICQANYEKKLQNYGSPPQEAPYLVFVWSNCVNGNYERFNEGEKALKLLGLRTEEIDCEHEG